LRSVSTQQIYGVVLEIRSSTSSPDTRWTFFQAPLLVEDALGFRFPVPSEYNFELLDGIIRLRFKTGPGAQEVTGGNYEIFETKNSRNVINATTQLLPGTRVTMAIIVGTVAVSDDACPIPNCGSTRTLPRSDGGRTWYVPFAVRDW
jgi:hypothetical protein